MVQYFLPKKLSLSSQQMVWDPGSKIQDPEKTYTEISQILGSRTESLIPDLQHSFFRNPGAVLDFYWNADPDKGITKEVITIVRRKGIH